MYMKRKENRFWKEKTIELLNRNKPSLFLDPLEFKNIQGYLKNNYQVFEPFKDSDYKIIYKKGEPKVTCFKINSSVPLTHSKIMGNLYSLNIEPNYIGDIVVDGNEYYFFIFESLKEYVKQHLTHFGSYPITLEEVELDTLKNYQRSYEELEVLVPSLRLDVVLSKLAHTSRKIIKEKFMNEEVTLNYEVKKSGTTVLTENDIFSMRRLGKFKFIGIKGTTKRDNLVLIIKKFK